MMAAIGSFISGVAQGLVAQLQGLSLIDIPGILIVALASVIVIYAFYTAVKVSIWPAETDLSHIKYSVLEEDDHDAH